MKKALVLFAFCVCVLQLFAQNKVEFLGLPVGETSKAEMAEHLVQRGYKLVGELDGYVKYEGLFLDREAGIILAPRFDDGIEAIYVSIKGVNPVAMGQIMVDLIQKYMLKYSDYKYTTTTKPGGATQMMFSKMNDIGLMDCVLIETKVERGSCSVSLTYACNLADDGTKDKQSVGIGIDDI